MLAPVRRPPSPPPDEVIDKQPQHVETPETAVLQDSPAINPISLPETLTRKGFWQKISRWQKRKNQSHLNREIAALQRMVTLLGGDPDEATVEPHDTSYKSAFTAAELQMAGFDPNDDNAAKHRKRGRISAQRAKARRRLSWDCRVATEGNLRQMLEQLGQEAGFL